MSTTLLEWKAPQEKFKGRRIVAPGGINFAASQFVFAGYSGEPFSNRPFNLHRAACGALGVGEITAHGLRHSAATILLNHVGTDLREIQDFLRHKSTRTNVRYTRVGYSRPADGGGVQPGAGVKHCESGLPVAMERKVTLSAKSQCNAGRAALNISALKMEQTKGDDLVPVDFFTE